MPTIVEVNGQEFEFPDSMSQDQIKSVLDQRFSQQPEQPSQPIMAGRRRRPQQPDIIEPVYTPEEQALEESSVDAALALAGDVPSQAPMQQEQPETITVGRGRNKRTIQQQEQPLDVVDYIKATPEVIKAVGAGATVGTGGYIHGFMEGLFNEIASGGFGTIEGAERIQQKALERSSGIMGMFAPESEAGREIMIGMGELTEQIPPFIPLAAEAQALSTATKASMSMLGANLAAEAKAISEAGKASMASLAAKMGKNAPLIDQKTGLPSKALSRALNKKDVKYSLFLDDPDTLPVLSAKETPDEIVGSVIRKRLIQRSGDQSLALWKLDGPNISEDKLGAKAVKAGFSPGAVSSAKNANRATKAAELEMLNMKRKIQGDATLALDFGPANVPGRELMKRFDFVKDKAEVLRGQLNDIAKGEVKPGTIPGPGVVQPLKGLPIDTSGIENAVFDGLRKINLNLPDEVTDNPIKILEFLKKKDAFDGSDISKNKSSQKVIKEAIELLTEGGNDAQRAHRVKKQLDEMIDFRKKAPIGVTPSGERFAKSIRRALNDSIREVHKPYARINDELSASLEVMNEITDALPKKIDIYSEGASAAIGRTISQRLLSNVTSREQLRGSIKKLEGLAQQFGADFETDLDRLVIFANTLDERFGATARKSLQGVTESAQMTTGAALRPKEVLKDKAAETVLGAINKYRAIDDEKAFNAMTELLMRKD